MRYSLITALISVSATVYSMDWNGCRLSGGSNVVYECGETLRVHVQTPTQPAWAVQILNPPNQAPAQKGDWLLLTTEVRSLDEEPGLVKTYIAGYAPNWLTIGSSTAEIGPAWKSIYAYGKAEKNFGPEKYGFTLHLGNKKQHLEFRKIELRNKGKDIDPEKLPYTSINYQGRAPDAPWRKEAEKRIEQYRKAEMKIQVFDRQGNPAKNKKVHIAMKKHAYGFGTFLEHRTMTEDSQNGDRLRSATLKMFNRCTCPIYYADWGWANPKVRSNYLECAQWAHENELETRGHCMIYPGYQFMPKEALTLTNNPSALQQRLLKQIRNTTAAMEPFRFTEYDVCNELRQLTELPELLGREAVVEWYSEARAYAPDSRMAVNENTILTSAGNTDNEQLNYLEWINYLSENGQQPDVIGMQGHFLEALTHPADVVTILDRFAQLSIPIHITEFDINTRDEDAQGDYTRDFITAVFSHPATEAITLWGFWEGRMWRPQGAMLRKDWSLKPNGKVWMDLIYSEWWTDETVTTDHTGSASVFGYLGDYSISVGNQTRSCQLDHAGQSIKIVLK